MARSSGYSSPVGRKPFRPFSSYLPREYSWRKRDGKYSIEGPGGESFDPLNPDIDLHWAGKVDDTEKFNTYYDYFFSGEDVKVYIDGLFDAADELDILSFNFSISQQQNPLYGFWSYNYDAMMLGVRIVVGELTVYTRYPGRIRDLLSKAAEARASFYSQTPTSQIQSYLRSNAESLEDERNIQKYWGYNKESMISSLDRLSYDESANADSRNIFSAHPPFNFIIKHGAQEGSLTTAARNKGRDSDDNYELLDRLMSLDFNDRLEQRHLNPMDIVLQSIHLNSMSTAYAPGGMALVETYGFTARDMYISDGSLKNPPTGRIVEDGQAGSTKTPRNTSSEPPTESTVSDRRAFSNEYESGFE